LNKSFGIPPCKWRLLITLSGSVMFHIALSTVLLTNNFTHAWHFLRGAMHHKGIYHAILYRGPRQVCCVAHGKCCTTRGGFTDSHAWSFGKLPRVALPALQTGRHAWSFTSYHAWPTFSWCHAWSTPIVTTDTTVHAHCYRL